MCPRLASSIAGSCRGLSRISTKVFLASLLRYAASRAVGKAKQQAELERWLYLLRSILEQCLHGATRISCFLEPDSDSPADKPLRGHWKVIFRIDGGFAGSPEIAQLNGVPWPSSLTSIFEFRAKVPLLEFLQTLERAGMAAWGILWHFLVAWATVVEHGLVESERPEQSTIRFAQPQEAPAKQKTRLSKLAQRLRERMDLDPSRCGAYYFTPRKTSDIRPLYLSFDCGATRIAKRACMLGQALGIRWDQSLEFGGIGDWGRGGIVRNCGLADVAQLVSEKYFLQ